MLSACISHQMSGYFGEALFCNIVQQAGTNGQKQGDLVACGYGLQRTLSQS